MKISILLPYKENFSSSYAGAVSLLLNDTTKLSKFYNNIKIYGSTDFKRDLLSKKYINLPIRKFFFQSSTKIYLKKFITKEISNPSKIIEIHNRPNYLNEIFKINPNIVLYFHNDPLHQKGSILKKERIDLLKKTRKIIFISNWVKNRFFSDIKHLKKTTSNYIVIPHSIDKVKIDINKKKKFNYFCWTFKFIKRL